MFHYCTCPQKAGSKACSHAGAVLLYKMLKDEKNSFNSRPKTLLKKQEEEERSQSGINYFKELFPKVLEEDKKHIIYFNFENFSSTSQSLILQRGVVKKDGTNSTPMRFTGKDFDFKKLKASKEVKDVLSLTINEETMLKSHLSNGLSKEKFYDSNTDLMMPLLKKIYFNEQELIIGAVFAKEKFHISWEASKGPNETYQIKPFFVAGKKKLSLINMKFSELGLNTLWIFDEKDRCFYCHKETKNINAVKKILALPKEITLKKDEIKSFFSKYYQQVLDSFEFKVSDDMQRKEKSVIPKPQLYLERSGNKLRLDLRFNYQGREINYFSSTKELILIEDDTVYDISRDIEEEDRIAKLLTKYEIKQSKKHDEFEITTDLIDFVTYIVPQISELGVKILGEENLFNFQVSKRKAGIIMEVKNEMDWFNIKGEVRFGKKSVEIEKVLEAVFQNKRFIDLSSGEKGVIPKNWINDLKAYKGFFSMNKDGVKLSKYHMPVLESLIHLSKKSTLDKKVESTLDKIDDFKKISPTPLSKNIKANLRNYQKAGYDWLNFLRDYSFNGILADDMGLGKTLQTLSLLQKIKDKKKKASPFLIVVPTSLIFNWKNEVKKFTPSLKAHIYYGSSREKDEALFKKMLKENDIIITTYGILRNDLALFAPYEFEHLILDEAHTIKNPQSISARTVCAIKSKSKLAISGTPIQNNLMELWSIFNFLSPGYLGTYDSFKENFLIPIEVEKDENVSKSLSKLINPFLLRRNKSVIAKELPKKTEVIIKSKFLEEEEKIYKTWKDHYSLEISRSIKDNGLNKTRLKILQGLTKLRQLSLHPKMIDPNYKGSSGKFDVLIMEITKILEEGHKILVFSSFVKMLDLIKDELELRGIKYSYLTGSSKNREDIVEEFQNSKTPKPFLISIKAGGVGINLTSADYVFIVDPWWNPSVEMQAMDRAHRIGQTKPVFVYKVIAEGSIEEKILELQKSKKKLVEDIITTESGISKNIDSETIKEIFG